jgi:hypothetical protein
MNPFTKAPRRIVVTVIASAIVLVAVAAAALGQTGSSSPEQSGPTGRAPSAAVAGAAIAAPTWCCTTGVVPGLTVTGQAEIKEQGTAARDVAIAEAVADATGQAKAAADAAGTQLGEILDMQVSAMPVAYPMMGASAEPGIAVGSTGSSTGASEPGATAADAPAVRYLGSATVTITWAIG